MNAMLNKHVYQTATATKIDRTSVLPSMVVSTAAVDRDGDRVVPTGGDFANYLRNPVLMWGHSRTDIPIGTVISLSADSSGVRIQWKWLEGDVQADRVKNGWDQGVVRAASISFLPSKSVRNEFGGHDHLEWELLEVSLVSVPCNAMAVRELKALRLWDDSEPEGKINWNAIKLPTKNQIDWAAINRSLSGEPEVVDITTDDVQRVVTAFAPAIRAGIRAGIRAQIDHALAENFRYMTGRLD
ncbi:MAG: HK97 family phage prohead protease [Nitrospira sp.]|nr:HK97 family phage prohead protease [Nitrospira sp.]